MRRKRIVSRTGLITQTVLAWALTFSLSSPLKAGTVPAPAQLIVTLEDSVLLEDQSIFMIVCLKNVSRKPIPDVTTLEPAAGHLQLRLYRAGEAEPIHLRYETHYVPAREGDALGPGEIRCVTHDLIGSFGRSPPHSSSLAARLGYPTLAAGRYTLEVEFRLHTGFNERRPDRRIRAEPVDFEIRPLSTAPVERELVRQFLGGLPQNRSPIHNRALEWLPRFYRSGYFMRIHGATGPRIHEIDAIGTLDSLLRNGVGVARRAAMLGVRLRIYDASRERFPGWNVQLEYKLQTPLERAVLAGTEPVASRTRRERQ